MNRLTRALLGGGLWRGGICLGLVAALGQACISRAGFNGDGSGGGQKPGDANDPCGVGTQLACEIGGVCYADLDVNPADPCERCEAAADTATWTPFDCRGAITVVYRSVAGVASTASPKLRDFDGVVWGGETELPTAASPLYTVRSARSALDPTTQLVATISEDGWLDGFACTPVCTVTNDLAEIWQAIPPDSGARLDIAFEQQSGDGLLVYRRRTTDPTRDLFYRTYDAGGWGPEVVLDDTGNPANVLYVHVTLVPDTTSDRIALIAGEQTNDHVNAWIWDGSAFGNNVELLTTTNPAYERIGAAWERSSGDLVVAAAQGLDLLYAEFTDTWSTPTTAPCATGGTLLRFIDMESNPNNDEIMVVASTNSSQLSSCLWVGSDWGGVVVHDAAIDSDTTRAFDFVWMPAGDRGLLVYGTTPGEIAYRTWHSPGTWNAIHDVPLGANPHPWVRALAIPAPPLILVVAMEETTNGLGIVEWSMGTMTAGSPTFLTTDTGTTLYDIVSIH